MLAAFRFREVAPSAAYAVKNREQVRGVPIVVLVRDATTSGATMRAQLRPRHRLGSKESPDLHKLVDVFARRLHVDAGLSGKRLHRDPTRSVRGIGDPHERLHHVMARSSKGRTDAPENRGFPGERYDRSARSPRVFAAGVISRKVGVISQMTGVFPQMRKIARCVYVAGTIRNGL